MTPTPFTIAKHLTAAIVAVTMAGLLLLGFDGLLGAMHKLSLVMTTARPPPPVAAPAAEEPATPGVVPVFVVPAADAAKSEPAR